MKARVSERLDDDGTYYTADEVLAALNAGLRFVALQTLCIERTANFTLSGATCWHTILDQLSDSIKIFRVRKASARIYPTTFHEQDCYSPAWEATAGAVEKYLTIGCNLIAFTPQPASGDTVQITYAACPVALVADSDTPEIPEEYHQELINFATFYLRLKEGGQELANELDNFQSVLDACLKLATYVRARCQAQDYDTTPPFDIKARDNSRRIKMQLQQIKTGRKAA
jgi:hypothetical protein